MSDAVTLPQWISIDDALGDLTPLIDELKIYAAFAGQWRSIGKEVLNVAAAAPIDSPVGLAVYLGTRIDDPAIMGVFDALGLQSLREGFGKLGDRLTDPQGPWAKLLQPCNAFAEDYGDPTEDIAAPEDGANPGLVALSIPRLDTGGDASLGPVGLSFGLGVEGALECEAGAVWPFRGDAVKPGLLRVGANGNAQAKGGAALPFGAAGKGDAEVATSLEARLDFFFRPARPETLFAEQLAPALIGLPDPSDLLAIDRAMETAGLEGVLIACNGAASAGLGVLLGTETKLADFAEATIGFFGQVKFKREANWFLSLRKTPQGLHFVLSRSRSRARDWSLGLGISADYSGLARQVHDILAKANDLSRGPLVRLTPFLSPGTYLLEQLRSRLDTTIASVVEQPALRAALLADMDMALGTGVNDDLALAAHLRARIVDLAAAHAGGFLSEAAPWAQSIASELTRAIPALDRDEVADGIAARIQPLLLDAKREFETLVNGVAQSESAADALKQVGIRIASAQKDVDAITAGLRDLTSKFDLFSRKVLSATSEAADRKLQARFAWTGARSSGTQYELMGTFRNKGAQAAELWRSLLAGRLESFQRLLADPASQPEWLDLDPSSSLASFAGSSQGFSLEVVVLGLSVSMRSIIEGKAQIIQSANGDVSISAEGSAERSVVGFDEGRSASFVSAWDLAMRKFDRVGGGQRQMSVAVAFDHSDKKLQPQEVSGFLTGLADQRLVERSRIDRALEIYHDWRLATPSGDKVKGQIDVRMALSGFAIDRMVALGRRAAEQRALLFAFAAQAMLDSGAIDPHDLDADCREARRKYDSLARSADPLSIAYAMRNAPLLPPGGPRSQGGHSYSAFARIIPRATGFADMLECMARIYDAIPMGAPAGASAWTEQQYAKEEEAMAGYARRWLRLNQKLIFWFKTGLNPVMLAFLRLLAGMDRPMLDGEDILATLGEHVDVTTSNQLFEIGMQRHGGARERL